MKHLPPEKQLQYLYATFQFLYFNELATDAANDAHYTIARSPYYRHDIKQQCKRIIQALAHYEHTFARGIGSAPEAMVLMTDYFDNLDGIVGRHTKMMKLQFQQLHLRDCPDHADLLTPLAFAKALVDQAILAGEAVTEGIAREENMPYLANLAYLRLDQRKHNLRTPLDNIFTQLLRQLRISPSTYTEYIPLQQSAKAVLYAITNADHQEAAIRGTQ